MVCMNCKKFYRPEKNGVLVEEQMPMGPRGQETWVPYKLWMADLYKCPGCGHEAVGGFSLGGPIREHYHADYAAEKKALEESYGPAIIVADCGPTHLGWRPDKHLLKLRDLSRSLEEAFARADGFKDEMYRSMEHVNEILNKVEEDAKLERGAARQA